MRGQNPPQKGIRMSFQLRPDQVRKLWMGFFGIWLLLVSGLLDFWIKSPGLKQWLQVELLVHKKQQEIAEIEAKSENYKNIIRQLETNPVAQEREIRKVLGYLGEQEVVFEVVK
jgi:cell division protein FtsB